MNKATETNKAIEMNKATVRDIYEYLNEIAPFDTQCHWDNSGFLIGDENKEVTKILFSLDITPAAVEAARECKAELIVSHHPVIFHPLESVMKGSAVYALIENGISAICCHTPLDIAVGGVNDVLAKMLSLKEIRRVEGAGEGMCRIGETEAPVAPGEFAAFISEKLNTGVKFSKGGREIRRVMVCGGAGAEFLPIAKENGCQAYVTADVKHHEFLEAQRMGITLFDAGHYETEYPVVPLLAERVRGKFSVESVTFDSAPCSYIAR